MESDSSSNGEDTSAPTAYAPEGHLCEHCTKLTNHSFRGKARSSGYGLTVKQVNDNKAQCRMCQFVHDTFRDSPVEAIRNASGKKRTVFRLVNERLASDAWPVIALAIEVEGYDGPPTQGLAVAPGADASKKKVKSRFVRPPLHKERLKKMWQMATGWLEGCCNHHRVCKSALSGNYIGDPDSKPPLPSRVVEVPAEGYPRLIETKGESGQYIALSYRWGDQEAIKLTKDRLQSYLERLPAEEVRAKARTLLDACEIARRLEINYLWIDSLCIIQDDDHDWERESVCMESYYSNALCTIAALNGESSEAGLSIEPPEPKESVWIPWYSTKKGKEKFRGYFEITSKLPPLRVRLPVTISGAGFRPRPDTVYPTMSLDQELKESHWSTRGWIYQERILSRRILYLGKHQMYWECQMAVHSSDGVDRLINDFVPHEKKRLYRYLRHIDNFSTGLITEMGMEMQDQYDKKGIPTIVRRTPASTRDDRITDSMLAFAGKWGNSTLVNNTPSPMGMFMKTLKLGPGTYTGGGLDMAKFFSPYSACHLTHGSDKLPAFGGVGEAIAKRTKEQFHAGVLTCTLARDLWWYPVHSNTEMRDLSRAPSWSWGSWNCHTIGFTESDRELIANDGTEVRDPEIWMQGGWKGALKDVSFLNENKLMAQEQDDGKKPRGVRPVSMKATALFVDVNQYPRSCCGHDDLWQQLTGLLRTWPPGYSPWDQKECHLLFAASGERDTNASTVYQCPTCEENQQLHQESSMLEHAQACKNGSKIRSVDENATNKLIGVARFDQPDKPPSTYRAILLWNNSDRAVFHGEDIYKSKEADTNEKPTFDITSTSMWGYKEDEMKPLHHSNNSVLNLERCNGIPDTKQRPPAGFQLDIGPGWLAKVFKRRKRNYFLLLVEPTEWPNHYRRVGIGLGYWIPMIERFGGLGLTKISKSEKVTLV